MRVVATIVGAAMAALLPLAPAVADSSVIVHGTEFPSGRAAQLSLVGCDNPYQRTAEQPQPYIGLGPDQAPAGARSLGYDLAGGNAIGSIHYVDSITATTVAGMSVNAPEGASGVTYVGYQEPADRGTGLVWFGRAPLSVAPGGWSSVDVAGLALTWTKFDMIGQQQVGEPMARTARILPFAKAHGGDGPGFFTIGFGCDGHAFNMDAWRIGRPGAVTTYDLEGLTTSTSISGPDGAIEAGQSVTLHGTVTDGSGVPLPGARLVLEAEGPGGAWRIVDGAGGPDVSLEVTPEATTTYRWRFVDRPLAEGSVSAPVTVEVTPPPAQDDEQGDRATPDREAKPHQSARPGRDAAQGSEQAEKPSGAESRAAHRG